MLLSGVLHALSTQHIIMLYKEIIVLLLSLYYLYELPKPC